MTMDEGFKNNVTKLVQMAQKVVQMTKIEITQNCLKILIEPISSMVITNMNKDLKTTRCVNKNF